MAKNEVRYMWISMAAVFLLTAITLTLFGRPFWCQAGDLTLYAFEVFSTHCSQHILDPYSFTHFEHGLLFFLAIHFLFPNKSMSWKAVLVAVLESGWEILENTDFIINRYRTATFSLDYYGDSIANSLSDILFCMLGFWLATRISARWSVFTLILTELILLLWVRDNLLLNILMLLYPIPEIATWQSGSI